MLRDHGFEVARRGRDEGQFKKVLLVPGGRAVRALAREAIAILWKVLDYDGATPLEFHLHLGTRLSAGFTFDGICADATCSSSCSAGASRPPSSRSGRARRR